MLNKKCNKIVFDLVDYYVIIENNYIYFGGIMANEEKLNERIKKVLLKYCPYTDDRLDLFDSANKPEFDIHFSFDENFTQVNFVFGNHRAKFGVPEQITVGHVVELDEIEELIDFIKDDHDAMFYDKHDRNKKIAEFKFGIRWDEEDSINGLKCSTIGMIFNFRNNPELEKKYLYFLNKKYFNSSDVSSVKEYTDEVIKNYINSLDKDGLMYLLNRMSEKDLKSLLIPNIQQIADYVKEEPKVKKYFIENNL